MKRRAVLLGGLCLAALPLAAQSGSALDWVNGFRRSKRRAPLVWSPVLDRVAAAHAQDMARSGFFSHTGSDGSDIGVRLDRAGYGWCAAAENIAKGHGSVADVLEGWRASPGHRRNMLNREVTEMALAQAPGKLWVMVLGRPGC